MPETPKKNAPAASEAGGGGVVAADDEKENIFLFVPNLIGEWMNKLRHFQKKHY